MSQAIEQADELRRKAIEILLAERAAIDDHLAMLSYNGSPATTAPNRRRLCGVCGSPDHNARRCPQQPTGTITSDTTA